MYDGYSAYRVQNFDEGVKHILHVDCVPVIHQFWAVNEFESLQLFLYTANLSDALQSIGFLILRSISLDN